MNADELEQLVRRSLEHDASTQPVASDLHHRSVAYGRRLTRRRRATAAALVLIVAFVAAISVTVSGNGKRPKPAVQPSPTLTSIAAHVEGLVGEGQKTSPWWYERIIATKAGRTDVAEMWQSRQGRTEALLDGTSTRVAVHGVTEGNVGPDASWAIYDLRGTDQTTFYSRTEDSVKADVGADVAALPLAGDLFGRIEQLLERGEFPPASRATLLRTLAMVPSVQQRGLAPDATGRLGLVVDPPNAGTTTGKRYLIDPASGLVIETQTLDAQGKVTARTTFAASAAVPAAHALPNGVSPVTPYVPGPPPSGQTLVYLP